jgi:hypothetical protein
MRQTKADLNRSAAQQVLVECMFVELLDEIERLLREEDFQTALNEIALSTLQQEKSFLQGRPIANKLKDFLPLNIRAGVWSADEDHLFEQVMGALNEFAKRMPSFVRQALSDRGRRPVFCGTSFKRQVEHDDSSGWG